MGENICKAEQRQQPPKAFNEQWEPARCRLLLTSAPKNPYSSPISTRTPNPKDQQTHLVTSDPETLSCTQDGVRLESFRDHDSVIVDGHRMSSLPLWTHRLRDGHLDLPEHERSIDKGGFCVAYPALSNEPSSEVNDLDPIDDLKDARQDHESVARHASQFDNSFRLSADFYYYEGAWHCSWTDPPLGNTQRPHLVNYQLSIWVYGTVNSEITLSERMEKSNWERSRLERL